MPAEKARRRIKGFFQAREKHSLKADEFVPAGIPPSIDLLNERQNKKPTLLTFLSTTLPSSANHTEAAGD